MLDEESTIAEQEAMEVEAEQKKELAELAKDGSLRQQTPVFLNQNQWLEDIPMGVSPCLSLTSVCVSASQLRCPWMLW